MAKLKCSRCRKNLPVEMFSKNRAHTGRGYQYYCKPCHRELRDPDKQGKWRRDWEVKNRAAERARKSAYKKNNSRKIKAHSAVYRALKRGDIVKPDTCSECGSTGRIHGHHEDYDKQLDVEWLCGVCHGHRHRTEYESKGSSK